MNSATTIYTLALSATTSALAISFWQNTLALFAVFWLFIAGYVMLYSALVRFRAPPQLSLRSAWAGEIRLPFATSPVRVPREKQHAGEAQGILASATRSTDTAAKP